MTLPRQVLPGCDYMVTRRCSERRFFLRPDEATNNAFIYCLALAARRARVQILFAVAMSNHHHTGIHDPEGNFPTFIEYFHGLLARCQNAHLGRFENFWSSEPTSIVRLVEPGDILDKMTYAFANPAAADLVDSIDEWPGVKTFRETCEGGWLVATRPGHFFRDKGDLPEVMALPIARPRGFEHLRQDEWSAEVTRRVRQAEAAERRRRNEAGISVLGRKRVLRQDSRSSPRNQGPHFKLNPRVAAKSKWARIEALLRNRDFVERYRAAFAAHLVGVANVLFPFGTYWMRKFGKVLCETCEAGQASILDLVDEPTPA